MTKHDFALEWHRLYLDLIECDPSQSAESLDWFHEIQEEQEELAQAITKAGFTEEEIENLAFN